MKDNMEKYAESMHAGASRTLAGAFRENAANLSWMALILFGATVVGYYHREVVPEWILKSALETVKQIENAGRKNAALDAVKYFGQVAVFLYLSFVLGIAAAIPPAYAMLSSALLSGAMAARGGGSLVDAFVQGVPDALETVAMWIALGWGAKLGLAWFITPRLKSVKDSFIEGHIVFFKVVIPLLTAALLYRVLSGVA